MTFHEVWWYPKRFNELWFEFSLLLIMNLKHLVDIPAGAKKIADALKCRHTQHRVASTLLTCREWNLSDNYAKWNNRSMVQCETNMTTLDSYDMRNPYWSAQTIMLAHRIMGCWLSCHAYFCALANGPIWNTMVLRCLVLSVKWPH
jgi:hypothetical protein